MVRVVHPLLVAYARRRLFDHALVDDIVAETLATAWRKWDQVPRDGQELSFLYGIERRVLANHKRSLRRQQNLLTQLEMNRSVRSDTEPLTDREMVVATAFSRLRPSDQEILTLSYWERQSTREIGVVLGCSENAATIRLHRARKRLEGIVGAADRHGDLNGEEVS
jgi:RNA polymerase sigma-70 factor (ECF subfamily)